MCAAYPFPDFWELQQQGQFSDILIFCQGGQVLKSHRMFLQLWLPWLTEPADAVILPHTSAAGLEAALQRLYVGLDPKPARDLVVESVSSAEAKTGVDCGDGDSDAEREPEISDSEKHLDIGADVVNSSSCRNNPSGNNENKTRDSMELSHENQNGGEGEAVGNNGLSGRRQAFICDTCGKELRSLKSLTEHKIRHHSATHQTFRCPECDKLLATRATLREHLRWHEGAPRVPCPTCGKLLASEESLRKHVKAVHDKVKPHACEHCDYRAVLPTELQKHLESQHLGIKYECDVCHQLLASRSSLHTHKKRHSGHTPFICTQCGEGYKRKTHLDGHMLRKHSSQEYQCPECSKVLKSKDGLDYHMRYHRPASHLPCSYCARKFVTKRKLAFHINSHTGERPFQCTNPGCNKAFPASDQLSHHKKICLVDSPS